MVVVVAAVAVHAGVGLCLGLGLGLGLSLGLDTTALPAQEWDFACEAIVTGCKKYKDVDGWLTEVRRWPPRAIEAQRAFLERRPSTRVPL